MCSFEKAIFMIAYYARFCFWRYSGAPYYLAYTVNYKLHWVCIDSISFLAGVDNHCLATMSPNKDHFKDLQLRLIEECTGIGTELTTTGKCTFIMSIEGDDGGIHKVEIPNSVYVSGHQMALLSRQHRAQQAQDTVPDPMRTCMVNSNLSCTLYLNQKFKKIVPFEDIINTPFIQHYDRHNLRRNSHG